MSGPLYKYAVAGYAVRLYANRIEIERNALLMKRTESILLRNITDVSAGVAQRLTITTSDGKTRTLLVAGKPAADLQHAILELL